MSALRAGSCHGVKSLCFIPLGQSQRAEVVCHCHPGPEGPVHPSAHLGSPQRMGKAPWVMCAETSQIPGLLLISGLEWPVGVWPMHPVSAACCAPAECHTLGGAESQTRSPEERAQLSRVGTSGALTYIGDSFSV